MERSFGPKPEPGAQATEHEPRSFRRIQGGDAAKAAEESAQESAPYQRSFGINLRATRGARFELEKPPNAPAKASPVPDSKAQNNPPASSPEPEPEGSNAGITKSLFRRLFRP